jgi:hypothetical protein
MVFRTVIGWISLGCILIYPLFFVPLSAPAQEVAFTPRYDAVSPDVKRVKKTPTPVVDAARAPQLYSLGRFNTLFKEMCDLLELDNRREKIFLIAKQGAEDDKGCPSCRAFARQLSQSCAPKLRIKKISTPLPVTPVPVAPVPGGSLGVEVSPVAEETTAPGANPAVEQVGDHTNGALRVRYPRTDLVEVSSQLSRDLYEFSPGKGPVFDALKSFEVRMLTAPDLTLGEREYFSTLFAYLFSAWAGRPGSPLELGTPRPEEVLELFGAGR